MLPTDPMILLSFLNTRLRDEYDSLESLCAGEGIDPAVLEEKLRAVGFTYDREQNRFR